MRNENETGQPGPETGAPDKSVDAIPEDRIASRRAMLRIAALGGAAVFTVRPGVAQAAVSALTCSIPVPQSSQSGKWIKNNGNVVDANAKDAYPGPSSPLRGEDVKNSLKYGTTYPGQTSAQTSAYNNYIKKLSMGKQGYTCYASIQSPARQ